MNGSGEFGILDKQIDVLRTGGILPEKDIISLCTKVGCFLCWGIFVCRGVQAGRETAACLEKLRGRMVVRESA